MSVNFSYYSTLHFTTDMPGNLLFPGRANIPGGTLGYIRSAPRARLATERDNQEQTPSPALPWRDYPKSVLTDSTKLFDESDTAKRITVSARNVLNEFGYRVRIDGTWWGRSGDPPVNPNWPVLLFASNGLRMCPLAEVEQRNGDILTGVPLVREGNPSDRRFLVACCSDVAHSYEVHPQGLIGPSAEAWLALSNAWEEGKQQNLPDDELADRMEQVAVAYGAQPSRNLLHSVLGQRPDGTLVIVALTGPLDGIAQVIVRDLGIHNAIVLDNGGSVGWLYWPGNGAKPILLVAGPNHRPAGTVFLDFPTGGFPQPQAHHGL